MHSHNNVMSHLLFLAYINVHISYMIFGLCWWTNKPLILVQHNTSNSLNAGHIQATPTHWTNSTDLTAYIHACRDLQRFGGEFTEIN